MSKIPILAITFMNLAMSITLRFLIKKTTIFALKKLINELLAKLKDFRNFCQKNL